MQQLTAFEGPFLRLYLEDKAFFGALTESVLDGIVVLNEQGRVVYINTSVLKLFGYSVHDVLGLDFSVLVSESETQPPCPDCSRTRKFCSGTDRQVVGRHRDGTRFPLSQRSFQHRGYTLVGLYESIS